ncbi:hypothetical protein ACROAE_16750 [Shewanella sp. MF05960]
MAKKHPAKKDAFLRQNNTSKHKIGKHQMGASDGHNIADKEQAQKP